MAILLRVIKKKILITIVYVWIEGRWLTVTDYGELWSSSLYCLFPGVYIYAYRFLYQHPQETLFLFLALFFCFKSFGSFLSHGNNFCWPGYSFVYSSRTPNVGNSSKWTNYNSLNILAGSFVYNTDSRREECCVSNSKLHYVVVGGCSWPAASVIDIHFDCKYWRLFCFRAAGHSLDRVVRT